PGEASFVGIPRIMGVLGFVGELAIDSAGTEGALVPVGESGVWISVPPDAVPDGTVLIVQHLTAEDNPPAERGGLWCCAEVEIWGLPSGVMATLVVPTRRPLPPGLIVTPFAERD